MVEKFFLRISFDAGLDGQHFNFAWKLSMVLHRPLRSLAIRGWDVRDQLYELIISVLINSGDRDGSVLLEALVGEQ